MSEEEENELICEKLLGWKRIERGWHKNDGFMYGGCGTPTFTTWAEAGLILDALQSRFAEELAQALLHELGRDLKKGRLLAIDIRAAALEYIRSTT